ncbi:TetR/AcrR family transcriptional regulator [Neisseriaceae bacterium B1]
MSKESRNNTYNRIIDASLKLFNEQGERTISTNHISQHLSISPGNLYYHFANKDEIIIQLFKRYTHELYDFLSKTPLPESVEQAIHYMRSIYDIMWEYRFLFSDVNALLFRSATLLGEHNEFTRVRISPLLVKLLQRLQEKGLIEIDQIGIEDLAVNMWLVTKYWFDFDTSMPGHAATPEIAKARGIYRTLSLLRPYMKVEHLTEFDQKTQGMNA